jgi:GNAT superfamily N-acetyltransferase
MTLTYPTSNPIFTIRFADRNDISLIHRFILSLAEYEKMLDKVIATESKLMRTLFDEPQAEVLIAMEHGLPIGFALFYKTYSTFQGNAALFLEDLFINPEYRRKGYGKLMFSCLATIARERGYSRIDWLCLDWNHPSIEFYKSIGAVPMQDWTLFRLQNEFIIKLADQMK